MTVVLLYNSYASVTLCSVSFLNFDSLNRILPPSIFDFSTSAKLEREELNNLLVQPYRSTK